MTLDRTRNPQPTELNTSNIDLSALEPRRHTLKNGIPVDVYFSDSLEIMRLDVVFEAGKAYADTSLVAITAMALITEGTGHRSAKEIADFLNFRGINIEKTIDALTVGLTIYLQNRYLDEFLPLLHEMLTESTMPENEFEVFLKNKRREFDQLQQKTNFTASRTCLEEMFGKGHVYGKYMQNSDFETITTEQVRKFYRERYGLQNCRFFLAGNVSEKNIAALENVFGNGTLPSGESPVEISVRPNPSVSKTIDRPEAVQTSIRIGKIIDLGWDSMEFAKLMVVNNLLGGGFLGSRLMRNLREEKGYCYGIYSVISIERKAIYMMVSTEVGNEVAKPAVTEIFNEIRRLQTEPVGEEELTTTRRFLIGDFIRGVDGVFELAERGRTQYAAQADDTFAKNYLEAIESITPEEIMELAKKHFATDSFVQVLAGKTE